MSKTECAICGDDELRYALNHGTNGALGVVVAPSSERLRDPRQRAEYLAASRADAAMADWRPEPTKGDDRG